MSSSVTGKIAAYDKKNPGPEMRHIDYGLGVLSAEVLQRWAEDEPFDLADVYRRPHRGESIGRL